MQGRWREVMLATCAIAAIGRIGDARSGPVEGASPDIELICGGGFTGAAGGRRADAQGRLWQVSQPLGAARAERALGTDAEAVRRWHRELDEAGFDQLSYRQPGNLSCTLSRGPHRITWSGTQPPDLLPAAVSRVAAELHAWAPPAAAPPKPAEAGS